MPDTRMHDGTIADHISRGAAQILREFTGHEPTEARMTIGKDTIAIILADPLTKGERSLVTAGHKIGCFRRGAKINT
jgi:uncharacterized protein YbcI